MWTHSQIMCIVVKTNLFTFDVNFLYFFIKKNNLLKENCQANSKKDPHFITSFIKEVSIHLLNVTKKLVRVRRLPLHPMLTS